MNKLKQTVSLLLRAARYSFRFCWNNRKIDTIAKLLISASNTLVVFLTIHAIGKIVSAVQHSMSDPQNKPHTLLEFLQADVGKSLMYLSGVLMFSAITGRLNWFFGASWQRWLRVRNMQELNDHRATLDVACFRSKRYDDLSKRIQELPFGWMTRFFFANEMLNLFTTFVSFLLFGSALFFHSWVYASVLVLAAIPMMIAEFKWTGLCWDLYGNLVPEYKKRDAVEKVYRNNTAFVQALMFHQMPTLHKVIDNFNRYTNGEWDKIFRIGVRREMIGYICANLGLCGVIFHALWTTVTVGGDIGTLTVLIAAARTFHGNLESIMSQISDQWNSARGVLLIEEEFFGLRPLLKTENPVTPVFDGPPTIRLEKVSFAYPEKDTLVLKDVSFTIESGTKVAIVGKSGNGKSTLQSLLMREYDPTSGAIYAEDTNLQNILPHEWTNTASALTQNFTILERKIGEEIASSRLDQPIDMEVVTEATRFAHFDEVVEDDPEGYESQIGTDFGGRDFSGGEKKRLALARVYYRGTPVLILDEPDSSLDAESAEIIMNRIFALQGITVILITHHVSRAERCDKVIVMNKGEVAEQGSPAELLAKGGKFASMCAKDKKRLGSEPTESESPESAE